MTSKPAVPTGLFAPGEKVFHKADKKLVTVLAVYAHTDGEVRLDWSGMTPIAEIEKYSPEKHAQYDATFKEIPADWKTRYGIVDLRVTDMDEVIEDILARSTKYEFVVTHETATDLVRESANLLDIVFDDEQVARAVQYLLDRVLSEDEGCRALVLNG